MKKNKKSFFKLIYIFYFVIILKFLVIYGASQPHEAPLNEVHRRAVQGELRSRLEAIEEIRRRLDPSSVDILVQIFKRNNPTRANGEWVAKVAALRVLRHYRREGRLADKALIPLMKILLYETNKKLQAEAAVSIGYVAKYGSLIDKNRAFSVLKRKLNGLSDDNNLIALMIIKGLKHLRHKDTIPLLKSILNRGFVLLVKIETKKTIVYLRNKIR